MQTTTSQPNQRNRPQQQQKSKKATASNPQSTTTTSTRATRPSQHRPPKHDPTHAKKLSRKPNRKAKRQDYPITSKGTPFRYPSFSARRQHQKHQDKAFSVLWDIRHPNPHRLTRSNRLRSLIHPPSSYLLLQEVTLKQHLQPQHLRWKYHYILQQFLLTLDHRHHRQLLQQLHKELLTVIPAIEPIVWHPPITMFPLQSTLEQMPQHREEQRAFLRRVQILEQQIHQLTFRLLHQELLSLIPAIAPTWPTTITATPLSTEPTANNPCVSNQTNSGFTQCTNQYFFSKLRPPDLHMIVVIDNHNSSEANYVSKTQPFDNFANQYYFGKARPPEQTTFVWCQHERGTERKPSDNLDNKQTYRHKWRV